MWPLGIVVGPPLFDEHLRLLEGGEDLHVQAFVPELSVKALVVAVFPG